MSVNDLPQTESYNLIKNKPPRFQDLPVKKILLGLSILVGIAAVSVVFLRVLDSRSRSASGEARQTPAVLTQGVPTRSPASAAENSFNPFASLLKTSQKEASLPGETVPSSGPVFSEADLKKAIDASLKLTDLEISEKSVGNISGCKMNGSYLGRIKGGNYYGRSENTYTGGEAAIKCQSLSLLETFSETFWIGTQIYNRNLKDKSFSKVAAGSSETKAQKVPDYLKFYFADAAKFKIISSIISGENIKVTTTLSRTDLQGQFVFILSQTTNKIIGFSFDLTSRIEGATVTAAISGDASFTTPSAAINTPSFQ